MFTTKWWCVINCHIEFHKLNLILVSSFSALKFYFSMSSMRFRVSLDTSFISSTLIFFFVFHWKRESGKFIAQIIKIQLSYKSINVLGYINYNNALYLRQRYQYLYWRSPLISSLRYIILDDCMITISNLTIFFRFQCNF